MDNIDEILEQSSGDEKQEKQESNDPLPDENAVKKPIEKPKRKKSEAQMRAWEKALETRRKNIQLRKDNKDEIKKVFVKEI